MPDPIMDRPLKIVGTRPIRPDGVDKVTGRANFGADMKLSGMLHARIKRSPHAHARIISINAEKALALPGVRAVVTAADFPLIAPEEAFVGEGPMNFRDLSRNVMARDKVLYEGHAVAAVAATSSVIAGEAVDLIEVEYEVLPFVIDVEDAMAPGAPVLHEDMFTQGVEPKPEKPSNIAKQLGFKKGDIEVGFREADVIIERRYTTQPVHQAYLEPHACVVSMSADGQATIWASSQGQFMIRAYCAKLLGMDMAEIRVTPAEIGGGFGGKTVVYLEPVALALSKKTGRAVKLVMTREDVFRGTGPTSGGVIEVKLGARRDGTITAAELVLKYQAGAFAGSPVAPGCMCAFAMYDLPHVTITGYDVVSNRPKVAAYRAPGAPISSFGVESCVDELARELGMDPMALREKNAAREGTKAVHGPTWSNIGYLDTINAAKAHANYQIPLGPNQGRGIACGFWFNVGGEFERGGACQRRRLGQRRDRQPRHWRLARLDGDDGGGNARHPARPGEADRRRHRLDRVYPCDRRQPRHLRDRHGDRAGRREGQGAAESARRDDLGHQPRSGRMGRRQGLPGRPQRRHVRPAAARRDRNQGDTHRRPDRRRSAA